MNPSEMVNSNKLSWIFWISLLSAILFYIWMNFYLSPLKPMEIVEYEMAKNTATALDLISQWSQNGKLALLLKSIYLDYIFIVIYCIAIATGCRYISSLTKNEILIIAGSFFSYFIFVAGIFDIVENIAMTRSLNQSVSYDNVILAYRMAISKFSIILMSIFFMGVCLFFWMMSAVTLKEKAWK